MPRFGPVLALLLVALVCRDAAALEPVVLNDDSGEYPLSSHIEILEDPDGGLRIEDVVRDPSGFSARGDSVPNLGLSSSAWWVRVIVRNESTAIDEWILDLAWSLADVVELHVPDPGGGFEVLRAGNRVEATADVPAARTPRFTLSLPIGETTPLYLRLASKNSLIVPLTIWSSRVFTEDERRTNLILGLLHGALFLAVAAGLAFFATLRDPVYLYYAALIAGFALWDSINYGLPQGYLWPAWWWTGRVLHISATAAGFAQIAFVRRFLHTEVSAPRLDRFGAAMLWLFPLLVAWPFVASVRIYSMLGAGLAIVSSLWTFSVAVIGLRRGDRAARYFSVAFSLLIVGVLPFALRAAGLVPQNFFSQHGIQLGLLLTSFTLWIGLADRIQIANHELRRLNMTLERRVRLRTRELEQTGRELERANATKREFLATASHDLRQPLHALSLLVGALRSRSGNDETGRLVEQVHQSAENMSELLDGLLDLSKLEAGMLEARIADFQVGPLLEQLCEEIAPKAAEKGIELHMYPSEAAVRSDPVLLRRIVQNLLTNAIRYTDRGRIDVSCEDDAGHVWIRVADTGRGIPESKRQQIFQEYTRLQPEDEARQEGLGLGLSIVQRLVALLDHEIALESEEGKGSVFRIRVTKGAVSMPAVAVAPVDEGFGGARVIAIDDDATILAGMRELLESWGCRVSASTTLAAAREAVEGDRPPPDAILADFRLSESETGIDAIAAIRSAAGSAVPALLLTADAAPETAEEARLAGLLLLRKPVTPIKLRSALQHLLASSEGAAGRS